jgi:hypothetical protein
MDRNKIKVRGKERLNIQLCTYVLDDGVINLFNFCGAYKSDTHIYFTKNKINNNNSRDDEWQIIHTTKALANFVSKCTYEYSCAHSLKNIYYVINSTLQIPSLLKLFVFFLLFRCTLLMPVLFLT